MKTRRTFTKVTLIALTIALLVTLLAPSIVATAAEGELPLYCTAKVTNASKLNLRREPQGEIIGKLARDKTVTILSNIDRNGYYFIRVQETRLECYAYGEYLSFVSYGEYSAPVEKPNEYEEKLPAPSGSIYYEGATLVVRSDKKLNMRKKPSKKGYRIKYLDDGDLLEVESTDVINGYILVRDLSDNKLGYVSLDYVVLDDCEDYYQQSTCNCNCTCPGCYCNNK